jgi:hypothetical protein
MRFFEAPEPVHEPEPVRVAWAGPPSNVLPAAVPLRLVLARTPDIAIAITNAGAFPTGFEVTLSLRLREAPSGPGFDPLGHQFMGHLGYGEHTAGPAELPPELFRFGVQFADGRKATTVGNPFPVGDPFPLGEGVQGPVLLPRGGGGGGRDWDQAYWVWPLPPPGPVAFVCEWPARGVEETRHEVDASLILDAAGSAETLWDEEPSADAAGAVQSVMSFGHGGPPERDQAR